MKRGTRQFLYRKSSIIGLVLIGVFFAVALAAPVLSPADPEAIDPNYKIFQAKYENKPIPPGADYPLGALPVGLRLYMDIYHSLVWGTRSALQFGLLVVALSATFGILVGAISGYASGWVNSGVMRLTDAFLAFPVIAGVVFIQQVYTFLFAPETLFFVYLPAFEPVSGFLHLFSAIDPLLIALVLLTWMAYARTTNSMVRQIKEFSYIEAARALGASPWRVIFRHLIPNTITPAIVLAARDIGGLVLFQATLAFIGLSESSPWGATLAEGRRWIIGPGGNLFKYWWVFFPISLAIILFGISWNLIGDNVNDWLNPYHD